MRMNKPLATALVLVGALAGTSSFAKGSETLRNGQSIYGQSAQQPVSGGRVVDVAAGDKLNVRCGDTVTFVNGAKRFTWKFDAVNHQRVDLAKIAPSDFGKAGFTVYVAGNDLER